MGGTNAAPVSDDRLKMDTGTYVMRRISLAILAVTLAIIAAGAYGCASAPKVRAPDNVVEPDAGGTGDGARVPETLEQLTSRGIAPGSQYTLICGPSRWQLGTLFRGVSLEWTPDGSRIVFSHDDKLYSIHPDSARMSMVTDANPRQFSPYGIDLDVSPDGTRIAHTTCEYPTLSSEGDSLLVHEYPNWLEDPGSYNFEIVVSDVDGSNKVRLTEDLVMDRHPTWSHSGDRLAFTSQIASDSWVRLQYQGMRPYEATLYTISPDGSNLREVTPTFSADTWSEGTRVAMLGAPKWSPDDRYIAFVAFEEDGSYGTRVLYTVEIATLRLRRFPVTNVHYGIGWSPDGEHLAFAADSSESGTEELILYTATKDGRVSEVHRTSYTSMVPTVEWSPNGTEIMVFTSEGLLVMASDGSDLRNLYEWGPGPNHFGCSARWSPDGSRVAVLTWTHRGTTLFTIAPDGSGRRDLVPAW